MSGPVDSGYGDGGIGLTTGGPSGNPVVNDGKIFGDPKNWKVGMGFGVSVGDVPDSAIPAGWKRVGKGQFEYVGTGTPPSSELQTPERFSVSQDWPTLNLPPAPNIGPRPTPTPFSYDPYAEGAPFDDGPAFSAPTVQDAESEPGYAFGKEQGLGAMRNALSAQGTFRTGGTPKAFFQWADQYAQQNYGRVYDRAAQAHDRSRANRFQTWGGNELQRANEYTTNRGNAFEGWKANNQLEGDVFDDNRDLAFNTFNAESARQQGMFAPKQRQAELTFDDMWRRFQAGLDAKTRIALGGD